MSGDRNVDFVLRTVEERDIRFIRLWFTDVLGNLKSFSISAEDLEEAFEEGIGFDGSSVQGFVPQCESDMLAFPDPTTFQVLPWRPEERGAARVFCDIRTPSREPFDGDPRSCLQHVFRKADECGYVMNVGPKLEYFYFDKSKAPVPVPLDQAGYFDLTSSDASTDLRRETTLNLEKMSIPVAYSYHSNAPSQNGIELRFAEAVASADNIVTSRLVIRQQAFEHGMMASFMPKPLGDCSGSGMFLYQSLFDHEGDNLFWAPKTENSAHLSPVGQGYVAGILRYAPEFTLVTNPTVNSYKRLVANGEVPLYTTWGRKNRATLVRIPTHKPGKHQSTRIELRSPDPTANPYLALAVTLAAGLRGVEEGLALPDEAQVDPNAMSPEERASAGMQRLPRTLGEAVDIFERSELMRDTLGDHIFEYLVSEKRKEWDEFCSVVTDWECANYYAGV
ncbi:L-glutamine synthetase [Olsenella uli DSM 7084]|uniref:L-glutamine synthetase n=1 Tax=Olsenella uli (strain ATCC 49627 / DSM 7084 / CCUG 31166 / CIP 109912 / JCM 12494 / LMG 11480 / NCIMB 702895 / VPI D76D-27C) TaxID=633147 RepID=E1QWE9_OLSUV|nr:glutamine synthetase family protein [Olsenella uli]ADK68452.1 L-glutamine synthetase [Olsenella uli DSM 7084]EUB32293.1 glutamine synthetase, beta-grasp domain protein [Olsenella uli MSTE5]KRO12742.1 L-glutamine synthetase [Olsenella uli DSM 7084]MBS6417904.1 glutamine synthetase [Olsenella uli]